MWPSQSDMEAFCAWRLVWSARRFLMKQALCFSCLGCAWTTRLWAISQESEAGVFLELWLRMEDNNDSLRLSTKDVEHGLHGGDHVCSPYLLVFGDDHVRGTREQMTL
ncbi:hypothetical protein DEO72_LG2g3231 [Vigna unguiculata]|uniref:Uncharacterized protein n=1 Tax=Vigna unguiculata TaxID=3917 RepID=A0A4D6L317_VIGUN|nr:hypothetical protein DEO72_LG2g3231 [Vigna unguiculata]